MSSAPVATPVLDYFNDSTSALALTAKPVESVNAKSAVNAIMGIPNFGTDFTSNWGMLKKRLGLKETDDRVVTITKFTLTKPNGEIITIEPGDGRHRGLAFAYFLLAHVNTDKLIGTNENTRTIVSKLTRTDRALARAFFAQFLNDAPGTHAMIDALMLSPKGSQMTMTLTH